MDAMRIISFPCWFPPWIQSIYLVGIILDCVFDEEKFPALSPAHWTPISSDITIIYVLNALWIQDTWIALIYSRIAPSSTNKIEYLIELTMPLSW